MRIVKVDFECYTSGEFAKSAIIEIILAFVFVFVLTGLGVKLSDGLGNFAYFFLAVLLFVILWIPSQYWIHKKEFKEQWLFFNNEKIIAKIWGRKQEYLPNEISNIDVKEFNFAFMRKLDEIRIKFVDGKTYTWRGVKDARAVFDLLCKVKDGESVKDSLNFDYSDIIQKKPREPFSIKKLIKPSLLLLLLIIIVVVCILLYKKSHESSKSYNFDYGEVSESSSEKGTLTPKNTDVKNSSTNTQKSSTAQKSSNLQLQQLMAVRENLKLRAGESTSTNVIAIMAVGDKVKILETGKSEKIDGINSSWVKVEVQSGAKDLDGKSIPAGTVGWCYGGYLTKNLNMRQDFDVAFIKVKGGTFKMGSDTIGDDDEKPAHSVTVSSFNLMKTEVTQKFYESVMGHNPSTWSVGQKFPVTDVNWYDAVEFCNKWSELDGLEPCYTINKNRKDPNNYAERDDKKWIVTWNRNANGYRLPTEAEWEYAAKGGVYNRNYTFSGSDDIDEVGWYLENAGGLHNVATKKPNDLGFYDMTGNAGEWCWDWRENYSGKSEIDPTGPAIGERRVLRSGSVYIYASWCRVTNREGIEPNQTGLDMGCMGIRVAKNE